MAGDWIKMRTNLRSHPKVVRIASALKADRLRVVGGLHAVWCLFDEHSEDGTLCGYTPSALDEEIGFPGFSDALLGIGWLESDGNDGLLLPEFGIHNGASAKRRAQEADRKRAERAASETSPEPVRGPSAINADKKRTREEKRREEKSTPPTPRGDDGFETFWLAWPKNERKQDKAKCAAHWKLRELDKVAAVIAADVRTKRGTQKWQEGYIEAPLVYLRGKRWEDGMTPDDKPAEIAGERAAEQTRTYLDSQTLTPEQRAASTAALEKLRAEGRLSRGGLFRNPISEAT